MEPQIQHGRFYVIEVRGSTDIIPEDVVGHLHLDQEGTELELKLGEAVTMDDVGSDAWDLIADQVRTYLSEGVGPLKTHRDLQSITLRECYGARLSAPGYLDCTDWSLHDTEEEAAAYLTETYGDEGATDADPNC